VLYARGFPGAGVSAEKVTEEEIQQALKRVERLDPDMANMLRNYIRGLENRILAYELESDQEE
jgi:hypothetical protein